MTNILKISFLSMLLMLAVAACAQPRYGIYYEELCWSTLSNGDSSIVRFSYTSSQTTSPTTLYYANADGDSITVSGGTLELCWCGAPVDVSNPPAFDPDGCITLNTTVNPFNPPDSIISGIGYQGFLTGIMDSTEISVTFDGSPFTNWSYNPNTGFLDIPATGSTPTQQLYITYLTADAPKTLQIIAENVAGSDTLTCSN